MENYHETTKRMRQILLPKMIFRFSKDELETLAFLLGYDSNNISGMTVDVFARNLILYCEKRGTLCELISHCEEMYAIETWPICDDNFANVKAYLSLMPDLSDWTLEAGSAGHGTSAYLITKRNTLVGISSECDVVLGFNPLDESVKPRVSRKHARILWREDHFEIEDISKYGTYLNTMSIEKRASLLLNSRDVIALGAPLPDPGVCRLRFSFSLLATT